MALFKVIKAFEGKEEKRKFETIGEKVELTIKRRNEIEENIEKSNPGYGPVLERLDAPEDNKETTKETPKEEVKETTEAVEK